MRGSPLPFFHSLESVGDVVAAAYWLAHFYHQSPAVFLAMTPAEIARHVDETLRMKKRFKI